MKKLFTLVTAMIFALSLNAKQVIFDFSTDAGLETLGITKPAETYSTNVNTATHDGVTMITTNGSTATRVYNANGATTLRIYNGGSITFTTTENITAVRFDIRSLAFEEISEKTWLGTPATSVTFTANGSNVIKSATIYIGETPAPPDTITVTDVHTLVAAADINDHYVKGVVMGQPFITYSSFGGKVSFWMNDVTNPNDTIEFFDGYKGKNNEKWVSLQEAQETLRVGDTILVYAGALGSYTPTEGSAFDEITDGYIAEILGKNPNPPVIVGPDTISVAQAIDIAQELAEPAYNASSTTTIEEYVVKGYAVKVYDKNSDGTWAFWMHDWIVDKSNFMVSNCTTDADVAVNDFMSVRGRIAKYKTSSGNIQLRIYEGTAKHEVESNPDTISAAEARTMAEALEVGAYSPNVAIRCFVANIPDNGVYNEEFKNISPWLNDNPFSTDGIIQAYHAFISVWEGPILTQGDYILVVGRLSHTVDPRDATKHYYQVAKDAQITILSDPPIPAVYLYANSSQGSASYSYTNVNSCTITALPHYGYHFTQWSDGIADNPRTIALTQDTTFTAEFAHNPVVTYIFNSIMGNVSGPTMTETGIAAANITFEASANYGCHFTQWSDGNTDNPRTIWLSQDTTFIAEFAYDRIGTCGKDLALVWSYDPSKKVLTIGNAGSFDENMQYGAEAPKEMTELVIGNNVTVVGSSAFAGIETLTKISIGESVKTIGEQAFYNCVNLETIYNYRPTPTNTYSNAFDGVDKFECKLYVLANSIDLYKAAAVWRDFYYTYAIGAEERPITIDTVTVEPGDNVAVFTWPTDANAASYTIQITKDGVLFCTLIFNANGQLTGIAFAPSRNGSHHTPSATLTANGMQFTVTGLNSGTHYAFDFKTKDAQDTVLASYTGEFTTTGESQVPTGIDETEFTIVPQKVMKDNQIYILRGDKTYTVTGQEVR